MHVRVYITFGFAIVFFLLGLFLGHTAHQSESAEVVAADIARNTASELQLMDVEAKRLLVEMDNGFAAIDWENYKHSFFLFENARMLLWSDNQFIPQARQLLDPFDVKLMKTSGGDYIVKKWPLSNGRFLIGVIQLYREYPIQNDYLHPSWNYAIFPGGDVEIIELGSPRGTAVCLDECLFKIQYDVGAVSTHKTQKTISVILITCSLIYFFIMGAVLIRYCARRNADLTLFLLVGTLWLCRYAMTTLDFPGMLIRIPLFDPEYYASSYINRSMGDLLLNELALLVICFYLFRNYYRMRSLRFIHKHVWMKHLLSIVSALLFFLAWFFPHLVIQNIYSNSAVTLDISQSIQFDTLRVVAYIVVIISWVCAFLVGHVFLKLVVANRSTLRIVFFFIIGMALFVLINEQTSQSYWVTLLVAFGYFIIVMATRLFKSLAQVNYTTFSYFFLAIVSFSIISALTIKAFTRQEKIETQFRFANNFLVDRDIFGEYLLREVKNKIESDVFIQSRISSPFLSKDAIRQKIRQVDLPSYFNKYDVEIMLFGAAGTPFDNRSSSSFSSLVSEYDKEAFRTEYDGVYFINSPEKDITQRYLIVIPITKSGLSLGYIVLELLLKKLIPENVYPELLIDNRFQQFYRMQDISYAVYGKEMLYSSGSYNYERDFKREMLGDPNIHLRGIVHAGYVHVAEEDENNRVAVVSSPVIPTRYIIANFSLLLVAGLGLLLLFILSQGIVNFLQGKTMSFSTRIQIFLNLAFFLPLLLVSFTTLQFTSISSKEQLNTEFLNKSKSFGAQVASMLDTYEHAPTGTQNDFENQLLDLSKLFNLDANVFQANGKLIASSQPFIFESGMIAPYVSPEALQQIAQGQSLFITTGKVGDLTFNTCYAALRSSQNGEVLGILGLPFFQSLNSLERIQVSILANILNVFSGIFIVLIVLSYAVSEWLTFPLRFITQSISRTSLEKTNQPLTWKADDEIGLMVKAYNKMLYKLSESKAELEQTQRERAWREIAQQVAHEIKNPLTPMKLTLQQLERSLTTGVDVRDKSSKAVASLLEQVNTLNDIASSFSSFAKMPEPEIHPVDLIQLMRRIVDLHSQSGIIHFKAPVDILTIAGDEQLLGRVFSNLILNAFQAARVGVPLHVDIVVDVDEGNVLISFTDNGKGIDSKVIDRVFVPHFSTKQTGSGLGLAISKQGIEHMHGRIWFETQAGEGTVFYVELPRIDDLKYK